MSLPFEVASAILHHTVHSCVVRREAKELQHSCQLPSQVRLQSLVLHYVDRQPLVGQPGVQQQAPPNTPVLHIPVPSGVTCTSDTAGIHVHSAIYASEYQYNIIGANVRLSSASPHLYLYL